MKRINIIAFIFFLFFVHTTASLAQTIPADSVLNGSPKTEKFVTKHTLKIDSKIINYTATVGTLILKNDDEEPIAAFGYTAYIKDGETDASRRPIIFAYNGGPGASSIWLNIGILGPRRLVVNDPFPNGPAPYKLEDNNFSLLDISDIVMLDPIGTGFSRPVGKSKNADFWGVEGDIKSVSQFIRNFLTESERWNSPKYLLGESYGTFRSAGVANYLQESYGISVNGLVLVSAVLDIRTLAFLPGDDLPYIVTLPTYAATSWYHNKLANKPASLDSLIKEVKAFTYGEYAASLLKGDQISIEEKDKLTEKLSLFTGLSNDYWDKADLRVNPYQYSQELSRNDGIVVGTLDSRYKGIAQNPLSEEIKDDPFYWDISPAFTSAFMNYLTTELKVSMNKTYNASLYYLPDFKWDWKHPLSQGYFGADASTPNTGPDLVNAMSNNPRLKVLVLNGYFDLATPFAATEYVFDHIGLDKRIKGNITMKYYESGHMMYIHNESAKKFKKDVSEFVVGSLK